MSKVGRNDPCPCGSGKKYKRCCIDKQKKDHIIIFPEISSLLHFRCITEKLINSSNTKYKFFDVYNSFCKDNNFTLITINNDISLFFEAFEKHIEEAIISHCCRYTSYELFYWHRRIHPVHRAGFNANTIFSCYELIKYSIFSFGTKQNNFTVSKNTQQPFFVPKYIEAIDEQSVFDCSIPGEVVSVLSDLYKLEEICFYYIYLRNCKRVAIKGGKIETEPEYGISATVENSVTKKMIELYDKRSRSQTLLSSIGTYSKELYKSKDQLKLVCMQANFQNHKVDYLNRFNFANEDESFNFYFAPIYLDDYYLITSGLNDVILSKHDFEIEDMLAILLSFTNDISYYIDLLMSGNENPDIAKALSLIQRGYLLIEDTDKNRREFVQGFIQSYKEHFPAKGKPILKRILCAFDYLFYQEGRMETLEFGLLKGFLFTQITRDKIIVDCTGFTSVLTGVLESLKSIDGEAGNRVSEHLEAIVYEEIKEIFGQENLFVRGELVTKSGKMKEIDASFIYRDILFIIECKSLSVSQGTILGEKGAIQFRKKKIMEYISEVEKKVDFLIEWKNELNVQIPSNVKYIASCVVTSFTEYIWEENEALFLGKDLPRILTIDELKKIKDKDIIENIVQKPFIKKI
jgi:hypothetical protein